MILTLIAIVVLAFSLRAIYRQGWRRGFEHHMTGRTDNPWMLVMLLIFSPGWLA